MKKFCFILLLLIAVSCYGKTVFSMAASIGKYAITSYDIDRMNDFLLASSGRTNDDTNAAFKELLLSYGLIYLADKDEKIMIQQQEIDNYINSITNVTNSDDPTAVYRQKIFNDYPDQFKLQIQRSQVVRALIFYYPDIKAKANEEVTEKEMRDFYEKNTNSLILPPMVDLIVVSAQQPFNLSLDELGNFEKALSNITETLKKSDDIDSLLSRYKNINFESYSGRTGLKQPYDLLRSGYPEEVLNIAFMEKIQINPKNIIIMKNGTVFGPQLVPFRKSAKNFFLIIKLIERDLPQVASFEKVRPLIEGKLKEDKAANFFHQYVTDKMKKGDIPVNIVNTNYQGAYDEFIRR